MPLILAIEPNKSQAQRIALLVKQHLEGAEMVTAGTAQTALDALGDRIPDLILTPALLAPKDEGALTDRLRQLGTAAAHIHTLAVPIIAAAPQRGRDFSGGLLGRRKEKSDTPPVGCDPSVFAEQIKVYLDRAARDREASSDLVQTAAPASVGREPDQTSDIGEDFAEIVWLSDEPVTVLVAPPDPPPVVEKKRARTDSPATRAFEAEFGLPPSASGSSPLWRVTEEGIDSMTAEPPPLEPPVIDEPPVVAAEPRPARAAKTAKPAPSAPKPRKQAPPLDDWAYFDPQQSPFKALIRRLDEIAGHAH